MAAKRLTHAERYEQQCAAEDKEEPYRLCSEANKLQAAKASKDEFTEFARQCLGRWAQRDLQRSRWRSAAGARDALDSFVEQLRHEVLPLKRPHSKMVEKWRSLVRRGKADVTFRMWDSVDGDRMVTIPGWLNCPEEDFADIEGLASSLKVVVDALLHHEALAKPGYTDPHPLNELNTVLRILHRVSPTIEHMTKVKKRAPFRDRNKPRVENARRRAKEYRKAFRDLGLEKEGVRLHPAATRVYKTLKRRKENPQSIPVIKRALRQLEIFRQK